MVSQLFLWLFAFWQHFSSNAANFPKGNFHFSCLRSRLRSRMRVSDLPFLATVLSILCFISFCSPPIYRFAFTVADVPAVVIL